MAARQYTFEENQDYLTHAWEYFGVDPTVTPDQLRSGYDGATSHISDPDELRRANAAFDFAEAYAERRNSMSEADRDQWESLYYSDHPEMLPPEKRPVLPLEDSLYELFNWNAQQTGQRRRNNIGARAVGAALNAIAGKTLSNMTYRLALGQSRTAIFGEVILGAGAAALATGGLAAAIFGGAGTIAATSALAAIVAAGLVAHKGLRESGYYIGEKVNAALAKAMPALAKGKKLVTENKGISLIVLGSAAVAAGLGLYMHLGSVAVMGIMGAGMVVGAAMRYMWQRRQRRQAQPATRANMQTAAQPGNGTTTTTVPTPNGGVTINNTNGHSHHGVSAPQAGGPATAGVGAQPDAAAAARQREALAKAASKSPILKVLFIGATTVAGMCLYQDPTIHGLNPTWPDAGYTFVGGVEGLLTGAIAYWAYFSGSGYKRFILAAASIGAIVVAQNYAEPAHKPLTMASIIGRQIATNAISAESNLWNGSKKNIFPAVGDFTNRTVDYITETFDLSDQQCRIDMLETDRLGNVLNTFKASVKHVSDPRKEGVNDAGIKHQQMTYKGWFGAEKPVWVRINDWKQAVSKKDCN